MALVFCQKRKPSDLLERGAASGWPQFPSTPNTIHSRGDSRVPQPSLTALTSASGADLQSNTSKKQGWVPGAFLEITFIQVLVSLNPGLLLFHCSSWTQHGFNWKIEGLLF